jgi:hypothetical protein
LKLGEERLIKYWRYKMARVLGQSGSWKYVQCWLNNIGMKADSPEDLYQQFELLQQKIKYKREEIDAEITLEIQKLHKEVIRRSNGLHSVIEQRRTQTLEHIASIESKILRHKTELVAKLDNVEKQISAETIKLNQQSDLHKAEIEQAIIDIKAQGRTTTSNFISQIWSWLKYIFSGIKVFFPQKQIINKKEKLRKRYFIDLHNINSYKKNLLEEEKRDIKHLHRSINLDKERYETLQRDKERLINDACQRLEYYIDNLKRVLHSKKFIGAKAELDAIQQLNKLPNNYYVLNDVHLTARRYMSYKGKTVKSAQIDHLVIANTGIFVVEVKHWSQQFVEKGQFFDPYEQVSRANYLCHCLLKEELNIHVKVCSILAYRGHLPQKISDNYVKVLPIDGLDNYINHFQSSVLTAIQLKTIINWLTAP